MFDSIKNASVIMNDPSEYSSPVEKNLFFKLPDDDFTELEKYIDIPSDLLYFW